MDSNNKPMLKKSQIWLPFLLSLAIAGGIFTGINLKKSSPRLILDPHHQNTSLQQIGYGRLEELIRYIEAKYVDKVDGEALVEEAIDHLLEQLDPHSTYISKKQLKHVNEQLMGNFVGIGIEFMLLEDTIVVVTPIAGGPSEAVGILAGDKIVTIEDSIVAGTNQTNEDVIGSLRGEEGTVVNIGVKRGSNRQLIDFAIIRDKIPTHSVDVAYMVDDQTGFIKVNRFSATTYTEFMENVEKLVMEQGMKNLIIDLRQNPGGYLQEATKMLSQFFDERGKLLVYTDGRSVGRTDYESTGRKLFEIDKIAVLIDEGSASASEIVSGALQDWDRGIIIGRRSFGKGLVQEQYKLSDGSALRITVARYFTPSGRSIQKDYSDSDSYDEDFNNRFHSGEMTENIEKEPVDSTEYFTASGRVVYGGGGISPDIFIPIDTMFFNAHYLFYRQFVPQFVFRYFEENREELQSMDKATFLSDFSLSVQDFERFESYVKEKSGEGVPPFDEESKPMIGKLISARLAKHLFDNEAFYKVYYEEDEAIKKALSSFDHSDILVEKK